MDAGIHKDFGEFIFQAVVEFLHRVQAHEVAFVAGAGAVGRRCGNERFFGTLFAHLVDDATFGSDDELSVGGLDRMFQERSCRTDEI